MIRDTIISRISLLLVLSILMPTTLQADETQKNKKPADTKKEVKKEEAKPKATTWAQIGISGSYPEGASMPGIFGAVVENLDTVLSRITKAATDDEIAGLILHISGSGVGWGKLNEFHRAIGTVKKSGKKVIAYMEDASTGDYLLAAACDKIVVAALKIGPVGQNRETGRASCFVCLGQRGRIKVLADQSFRRRSLLDLGDQAIPGAGDGALEGREESARGRGGLRRRLKFRQRAALFAGGDMVTLVGTYFRQHVAHDQASLVIATILSSAALAWPLSMAAAAISTPCLRSLALPATISAAAAL